MDPDSNLKLRNFVSAQASKGGSKVLNVYAINDRKETLLMFVIAHSSEEALELCRESGLTHWHLDSTVTRRIQRNVEDSPRVMDATGMHGAATRFRLKLSAGRN